ncbi:MAG: prepilin-type N-terminal cleavage/methylation domain-containing protein [Campylobacter sp.]|uniref:type II secretion system protein n=1 Tax=Campylobacter sp. TaxID=205 RepID=UPI001B76262A|nr:prepilin-type N-terminal cleavage/methylation domain-containing protein [Campylobacter sp.]MBP3674983.1 prepilin-type N-terminal cleavage/methylation domain-containing protein [Campylobacter sp.]
MKFSFIKFNHKKSNYAKSNTITFKSAFSLLEMSFVIVIGGILAGIMIQIYSSLHTNYLQISATNRLESTATNTMLIINNYLQQSIKESISTRNGSKIQPLYKSASASEFIWFSKSFETLQNSSSYHQWSGFIDILNIQTTNDTITLHSPLSKFDTSKNDKVLNNLKLNDIRIIFKGSDEIYSNTHKIISAKDELITIKRPNRPIFISEIYYLTHALISLNLQNNTLYLNEFKLNNLNKTIRSNPIARNVSSFNIKQSGANIIFQLCLKESNGIELCKSSSL